MSTGRTMPQATTTRARTSAGLRLPDRYLQDWRQLFLDRVLTYLEPGMRILDVGSGRVPVIPVHQRPENCWYVGLDISSAELMRAPAGSYDEVYVADVVKPVTELYDQFDLVVSFQVLEHVKPLDLAFDNTHSYLRAGGRLLVQFSGSFAFFALINQVLPASVGVWLLKTLLKRDPEIVFPAHYHHCWHGAIEKALERWQSTEIVPIYRAGQYLRFCPPLQRLYLLYENWAMAGRHRNLATHYIVDASR